MVPSKRHKTRAASFRRTLLVFAFGFVGLTLVVLAGDDVESPVAQFGALLVVVCVAIGWALTGSRFVSNTREVLGEVARRLKN